MSDDNSDGATSKVLDPTKNVLALVDAQAKFDNAMREHERLHRDIVIKNLEQYQTSMLAAEAKRQDGLRSAETRRVDDLAAMKKDYDKQIGESQTVQLKTTSDLVSTQLDKVTTSLSDTINKTADNIAAVLATMDKRLAGVEQFRYETGGRSSVADPAIAEMIAKIERLNAAQNQASGQHAGVGLSMDALGRIVTTAVLVITMIIGVVGVYFAVNYKSAPTPIYYSNPGPEPKWAPAPAVPVQPGRMKFVQHV